MGFDGYKIIRFEFERYIDFLFQRNVLAIEFPFVKCCSFGLKTNSLTFRFTISDNDWECRYSFVVRYFFTLKTQSDFYVNSALTILEYPFIKPDADIHLLQGQVLCLSFPGEFSQYRKLIVAKDIIPKCIDWVNNYELWKKNGHIWVGNQRRHGEHKEMECNYKALTGKDNIFD